MLVKQQISLYLNYIAFFHISQHKQLTRLLAKLQEFDTDIEANLNVNGLCSINDIENTEPINDFFKMDEDGLAPTISQYSSSAQLDVIQQIKIEMVEEVKPDDAYALANQQNVE
jgi:hypothetical protein